MLPFFLVLLAATSALAAPYIEVNQIPINEVAPQQSNGRQVGGWLVNNAVEIADGGDLNVNILTAQQIIGDIANSNNPTSQALALGQTLALLSQVANGDCSDTCALSGAIDAYVSAARSGRATRGAASKIVKSLVSGIDSIVQLATNPNAARFASGSRGNCNGGGANYQFEEAWNLARSSGPASSEGLLQESYCAVKRLNGGFSSRSRNVAAAITAASLPQVVQAVEQASGAVSNLLRALSNGSGVAQAARLAQNALANAV